MNSGHKAAVAGILLGRGIVVDFPTHSHAGVGALRRGKLLKLIQHCVDAILGLIFFGGRIRLGTADRGD